MTFHAFVTRYLDDMRQTQRRSNKTIEAYARDLQQAIGFFGEDAKIQSLDTLSVIGWVRSLSAQRIAGRSIGRKPLRSRSLPRSDHSRVDQSQSCSRCETTKNRKTST